MDLIALFASGQRIQSDKIKLLGVWQDYNGVLVGYDTNHFSETGSGASFEAWDLCH
jgi:hypothetical protein